MYESDLQRMNLTVISLAICKSYIVMQQILHYYANFFT